MQQTSAAKLPVRALTFRKNEQNIIKTYLQMQDEWNFVKVIHLGLKLHRGKKYIQFDLYTKSMQLHF